MLSALAVELKQTKPFTSLKEEAALSIARTAALLDHQVSQALKAHALTPSQYNVLRILRGAGGDGLPCLEVGARMITRVPDITRLVDRLEAAGLVERRRTAEDRRVVMVSITKKGLAALAPLDAELAAIHKRQMGHMARHELEDLSRLLVKARPPGGNGATGDNRAPGDRAPGDNRAE